MKKNSLNELYRKVELEENSGGKVRTRTDYMSAAVIAPIEKNEADIKHNMARLGITKIHPEYYRAEAAETGGGEAAAYVETKAPGAEETQVTQTVKTETGKTGNVTTGATGATDEDTAKKPGRKSKAILAAEAAATTPGGLGPNSVQTPGANPPATEEEAKNGGNLPDGTPPTGAETV